MTTQSTPAYKKMIKYDRFTKDYAMSLDGNIVGYARTYQEAGETLDALVHELLTHPIPTADAVEAHRLTLATTADMEAMQAEKEVA